MEKIILSKADYDIYCGRCPSTGEFNNSNLLLILKLPEQLFKTSVQNIVFAH